MIKNISPKDVIALLYVRVSTPRQVKEGNGLDSQAQRCEKYAELYNYRIWNTYKEEGENGNMFDRPAMKELLHNLDVLNSQYPLNRKVVIFDDLKRFARDVRVHFGLKEEIVGRGAYVESPNFKFEDSPEGEFIETVVAAQAALERKQNVRQVIQKQKARLERGAWPFCNPPALEFYKDKEHGKLLRPREPYSSIYKEAIEKFESNVFISKEQVRDFINSKYVEFGINKHLSKNGVDKILKNILYAGYVEYSPWQVSARKALFKGFISYETFLNVQKKLEGRAPKRLRKDYRLDFPLRGYVTCAHCGNKLTASWNTGRSKRYPKYWCRTEGCIDRYVSTDRDILNIGFEELLLSTKISENKLNLAEKILRDVWDTREEVAQKNREAAEKSLKEIYIQVTTLTQRLSKTTNYDLIDTYEVQITELLEKKKNIVSNSSSVSVYSDESFGTALSNVLDVLKSPLKTWKSNEMDEKVIVPFMYFDGQILYTVKNGFGTASFVDEINILKADYPSKGIMVEMGGFEPPS